MEEEEEDNTMNFDSVNSFAEPKVKKPQHKFKRFIRRHPVMTAVLFGLLAVIAVYFWKEIEGNLKKKAAIEVAMAKLDTTNQTMLELLCKPLVWNIRSEMLRGNMDQIDLFFTDFVKEKNFIFIMLVEPTGKVILSTDKRLEGNKLDDKDLEDLVSADSTSVNKNKDGIMIVSAPVMGYDKQLSTLIFGYRPETLLIEK